jgi:hypothetical protein
MINYMKNFVISEDQVKKIIEEISEAPAKFSYNSINTLLSLKTVTVLPKEEPVKEDKEKFEKTDLK